MRKIYLLITCVLMSMILTACSDKETIYDKFSEITTLNSAFDKDNAPFNYSTTNSYSGLDVDTTFAFAEHYSKEINLVEAKEEELFEKLDNDEVDFILADINTYIRNNYVVSNTYRYGLNYAIINKDFASKNNINNNTIESILFSTTNLKVVALENTTSQFMAKQHGITPIVIESTSSAIEGVSLGDFDILVGSSNLVSLQQEYSEETFLYSNFDDRTEVAFVSKDQSTIDAVNEFLGFAFDDGSYFDIIGDTYDAELQTFFKETANVVIESASNLTILTPPEKDGYEKTTTSAILNGSSVMGGSYAFRNWDTMDMQHMYVEEGYLSSRIFCVDGSSYSTTKVLIDEYTTNFEFKESHEFNFRDAYGDTFSNWGFTIFQILKLIKSISIYDYNILILFLL